VTDERFGPTGEEGAPRRVPIYDRRIIRPDDPAAAPRSSPEPGGTAGGGPRPSEPAAADDADDPERDASELEAQILVDEAALEADVKEEVRVANEKAAEHLADLQRLQADFANYRKRVMREQTEMVERAAGHLVNRLLSVLDSFEFAVSAAEETKDFERMLRGVEMVLGELKEVLHAEGLQTIPAKDRPFDPNLHEAALEVPGDEDGDMVVAGVLRPGYMLKGRILRPAMVKVTRRRAAGGEGEPAQP
jgi:molecular chaperone GrpE